MDELILIQKIVNEKIKKLPLKVKRIKFGFFNKVYNVIFSDLQVIVRTNRDEIIIKNYEKNLNILRNLHIPVPEVILMDDNKEEYGIGYMILSKIEGRDLRFEIEKMSKEEMSLLAEKVVLYQEKVMKLPEGKGFGRANINEVAKYDNWLNFIEDRFFILSKETSKFLDEEKINSIHRLIKDNNRYFEAVKPLPFMDEIGLRNVMIKDGELKGFIDFDWICYGDPLYLIGLLQTGILLHMDKKCIHYVEELCRFMNVTYTQRKIVDIYSIIYALEFISFQMKDHNIEVIDNLNKRIEVLLKRF